MASPFSSTNPSTPMLKTYFKTPEGRYKLEYEKIHSAGIIHCSHGKWESQLTIAYLKEKSASQGPGAPSTASSSGVVKATAARLLVGINGIKTFTYGGTSGGGKMVPGSSKFGGSFGASADSGGSTSAANFDGNGTYLIFNAGNSLFISDLNSQNKDPIKCIHFSISNPLCHAFDSEAEDGHDLIVGLRSGDIYTVSLRQQLQDFGKKLVGAQHYNKDGAINNSRCTCVAWVPDGEGFFVSAHADGNIYVYGKNKDGAIDPSFPAIKDPTQFTVTHARSSKCNPIIRWHIFQGPINNISFSTNGSYLATVGRDGYLRVFDYFKEQLFFGGKSYFGGLLCCAWSPDNKYILTGGEDDLVHVWSTEDRKIVACGEGHNSWVSGVSFDPHWTATNPDSTGESVVYRFGSVGQDTQLLIWNLEIDEISVPMRCHPPCGGSPTLSSGSHSFHWDAIVPPSTLLPFPAFRHVPKLSPLAIHRAHVDPLSALIFAEDSLATICLEGHIKIWAKPACAETSQAKSDAAVNTVIASSKDSHDSNAFSPFMKANASNYEQTTSDFLQN